MGLSYLHVDALVCFIGKIIYGPTYVLKCYYINLSIVIVI